MPGSRAVLEGSMAAMRSIRELALTAYRGFCSPANTQLAVILIFAELGLIAATLVVAPG